MYLLGKFLREGEGPINAEVVSDYLLGIGEPRTRKNYLSASKRFFTDYLKLNKTLHFKRN